MPTVSTAATGSPSAPVAQARRTDETSLAGNFETFLKLLTTQLRSQDPLSPMDTDTFTSQLVQFSSVEQALKANRQLEQLVSLSRSSAAASGLAMVGRKVEVDGSRMLVDEEGGSTIYELASPATSVTIRIFDPTGRLVHTAAGTTSQGTNRFDWDGKLLEGQRAPAGLYKVAVSAVDAQGRPVEARLERTTTIDSVETRDSGLVLIGGGLPLAPEAVRPLASAGG